MVRDRAKIGARSWSRKKPTGFTRPKRTSLRSKMRAMRVIMKKASDALLADQIAAGAKSLTGRANVTDI